MTTLVLRNPTLPDQPLVIEVPAGQDPSDVVDAYAPSGWERDEQTDPATVQPLPDVPSPVNPPQPASVVDTGQPAAGDDAAGAGAVDQPQPTLYRHAGSGEIDAATWPDSGLKNAAGEPLYTFTGDKNPGDATGASGEWVVDTAAAPNPDTTTTASRTRKGN